MLKPWHIKCKKRGLNSFQVSKHHLQFCCGTFTYPPIFGVTGGTDNHLLLWDVRPLNLTGEMMATIMDMVSITANKNMIVGDRCSHTNLKTMCHLCSHKRAFKQHNICLLSFVSWQTLLLCVWGLQCRQEGFDLAPVHSQPGYSMNKILKQLRIFSSSTLFALMI